MLSVCYIKRYFGVPWGVLIKKTPYATTFVPKEHPIRVFLFSVQAGTLVASGYPLLFKPGKTYKIPTVN